MDGSDNSRRRRSPGAQHVAIRAGHASVSAELGTYYIEMPGVVRLVESGFHGPLDRAGIPLSDIGAGEHVYNPIVIAQYALALHDEYRRLGRGPYERKFATQVEAIMAQVERKGEWHGFFIHRWNNVKYRRVRAPWVSALSQGTAISALLRGYQLWRDESLLGEATAIFRAMERPIESGGVRSVDACGHLWFEEYPMTPPCHVLNGFIFALWGVIDFARATGDRDAWSWWHEGVRTLKAHLPEFDCGFWSVYDLRYRELAGVHYHLNIHAPQLEAMYGLTGEGIFLDYANRWRRFGKNRGCRFLWSLGLRIGAARRGWRFD
jgi:heparosan-N-sulfate-glucuronate 5-epimerase